MYASLRFCTEAGGEEMVLCRLPGHTGTLGGSSVSYVLPTPCPVLGEQGARFVGRALCLEEEMASR